MKFTIVLYKALGIGMIVGIVIISILVTGLIATVLADNQYGTHVTAVNVTRWISMVVVSTFVIPLGYKRIRCEINSEIR